MATSSRPRARGSELSFKSGSQVVSTDPEAAVSSVDNVVKRKTIGFTAAQHQQQQQQQQRTMTYPKDHPSRTGLDGNLMLPHGPHSGDPYYIGDVYEQAPSASSREWALGETGKRPYLGHIKAVSAGWPHLRYLADWMEATTSPVKWRLIKDREAAIRAERAARTNVAIIEFHHPGGSVEAGIEAIETRRVKDHHALARALSGEDDGLPRGDVSRLYVVEDLSRDVIEILGSALDIDPLFFRAHISDYLWYNTRDPWIELPELRTVSAKRKFFHVRYLQSRYFKSPQSFDRAREQAGLFNVLRRLDDDRNYKPNLDELGTCFAMVRSKMSFWQKPAEPGVCGAVGILLVDPSITEGYPMWAGYRPFEQTPSMRDPGPFEAPPRDSLFESVVFWTQRLSPEDAASILADPHVMAFRALEIVCAQWWTVLEYITTRLSQIEWEIENPDFRKDASGINASLTKLHTWRRGCPMYKTMISETVDRLYAYSEEHGLERASGARRPSAPETTPRTGSTLMPLPQPAPCMRALHEDLHAVQDKVAEIQLRIENIVAVATAVISIEEARRAYSQNESLARLTYLAVIFAPLSFISSFFSMSSDLSALGRTIWIYFCVAVPFSLLAVLVVQGQGKNWAKKVWRIGRGERKRP